MMPHTNYEKIEQMLNKSLNLFIKYLYVYKYIYIFWNEESFYWKKTAIAENHKCTQQYCILNIDHVQNTCCVGQYPINIDKMRVKNC